MIYSRGHPFSMTTFYDLDDVIVQYVYYVALCTAPYILNNWFLKINLELKFIIHVNVNILTEIRTTVFCLLEIIISYRWIKNAIYRSYVDNWEHFYCYKYTSDIVCFQSCTQFTDLLIVMHHAFFMFTVKV